MTELGTSASNAHEDVFQILQDIEGLHSVGLPSN